MATKRIPVSRFAVTVRDLRDGRTRAIAIVPQYAGEDWSMVTLRAEGLAKFDWPFDGLTIVGLAWAVRDGLLPYSVL